MHKHLNKKDVARIKRASRTKCTRNRCRPKQSMVEEGKRYRDREEFTVKLSETKLCNFRTMLPTCCCTLKPIFLDKVGNHPRRRPFFPATTLNALFHSPLASFVFSFFSTSFHPDPDPELVTEAADGGTSNAAPRALRRFKNSSGKMTTV